MLFNTKSTMISNKPWAISLWLVLFLGVTNSLFAAAEVTRSVSSEDRLEVLEKQLETANRMRAEFQFQITNMQNEIRELRGIIEEQTYQIEQITSRQREIYKQMDQARLPATDSTTTPTNPASQPNSNDVASQTTNTQPSNLSEEEIRAVYDGIFPLVRSKRFDEAIVSYQEFIANYPDSNYVANSRYWLAQIFSVQNRVDEAEREYLLVAQQYPDSSKAAEAWLKLGQLYENQNENNKAIQAYQQLLDSYADSNAAKFATSRLQALGN